jgi:small GTP-binding protein
VPTVFGNYSGHVLFGGATLGLNLWDTAGQDEYVRLRPLSYPQTDMFLVCFDVANRTSFENVASKWKRELGEHRQCMALNVKFVLVGNKIDLREDAEVIERLRLKNEHPVTCEEGIACAKELGMAAYAETSALTGSGVAALFGACCAIFMQGRAGEAPDRGKCVVQ